MEWKLMIPVGTLWNQRQADLRSKWSLYTKDSDFELIEFSDVDYAGCKDTFKSTSGGAQFLGEKLVWISQKSQENSQKRANTDTRIRRVQKEAKDPKP
ncbi:hypothetical protein Tco_0079282 [Tanacetum coccineum]